MFFLVAAFVLLLIGRWVRPVNNAALTVSAPFAAAVSGITTSVGDSIAGVVQGPSLFDENRRLRQQIGLLIAKNIQLQEHTRDDKLLRRMVNFDDANSHFAFLTARVIGESPDPIDPYIYINVGRRDHLQPGMTVVDQNGYFVGTLSDVLQNMSKVLVMVNPSSSVGAADEQTRAAGMIEGQYGDTVKFDFVPTHETLHVGDLIVTSGLMNQYPRGLLMGQVTGVSHSNVSIFQTGKLRPAADFRSLELVQVVRSFVPTQKVVQP